MPLQRAFDLAEDGGVVDGGRHGPGVAVGDLLMVPRRILPDRVFGSRATVIAILNAATGPIFRRTKATISFSISVGGRSTPALRR